MLGVTLPDNFSAKALFENINSSAMLNQRMFRAAMKLKKHGQIKHFETTFIFLLGYLIGVLTNNWTDVNKDKEAAGEFFTFLNHHFHAVVESCKVGVRKPDQVVFKIACERLKTDPHEVCINTKNHESFTD